MGILVVKINNQLEQEFRKYAFIVFGQKKGSLSRAIEEAIRLWLANVKKSNHVSFDDLEVDISSKKKNIVDDIMKNSNEDERKKIRRLLEALGVA